ncbi:hypothetical protein [Pasteurella canis]|uniref:hypothetical protein n=1 Tax=Pasteurella canis TaxID=753 RepID=UPI0013255C93|nr:hypothetical protein [Pasteurella canis]MXN88541.1 hypothetical protein [Pasteurella canis]
MKAFDLEKALAGEPVVLKDGSKAFIKFRHFDVIFGLKECGDELINKKWDINGTARPSDDCDYIVGMWEGSNNLEGN